MVKQINKIMSWGLVLILLWSSTTIYGKTGATEKPACLQKSIPVALKILPLAGSPWALINLFPGIMLNGTEVGGSLLGQKVVLLGLGAPAKDTVWHIDGTVISDPDSLGTLPTYMNLNFYEEVQVTTAAHDVRSQTGGVQVNFVTRRGGNRLSGAIYGFSQGKGLEMKQKLPDSMIERGESSAGINHLLQYGLSLGGPIWKDKIWFFGAYGKQDIETRDTWGRGIPSKISSFLGKLDFQSGGTSGSFHYQGNRKTTSGMPDPETSNYDPEMVWDLEDPFEFYQVKLGQVIGNLELNAKLSYAENQYTLDPRGAEINPGNGHLEGKDWFVYDLPQPYQSGSLNYLDWKTTSRNSSLDSFLLLENILGTSHEIRFGVDYYQSTTSSQVLYPNQRVLYITDKNDPASYKEIWWKTDSDFSADLERLTFYLGDRISWGRLSLALGLHFHKEIYYKNEIFFPGLTFEGKQLYKYSFVGDMDSRYRRKMHRDHKAFSPRIALDYSFDSKGDHVMSISYGRYRSSPGNFITRYLWTGANFVGRTFDSKSYGWEMNVPWYDNNANDMLEWGEWSEDGLDMLWLNVLYTFPYAIDISSQVLEDFNTPILNEYNVAYCVNVSPHLGFTLSAIYKKESNLSWEKHYLRFMGGFDSNENWYPGGTHIFADGKSKQYYLPYKLMNTSHLTNYSSGTYNSYKSLQLVVSKKLSRGWMLDASFTWQDWRQYLDEAEVFDKTNFDYFDGGAYAPQALGEGMNGIYVNSRWLVKVAGMVQLPLGINLSGVFQAREGYITPYYELIFRPGLGWTKIYEPGKKFGDDRLPAFWMLDLGLEKSFRLSDTALLTLLLNGYNITNNSSTLNIDTLLGTDNTGDILRVLNPGIFQFGARLSF